jgi:glycosyltransferase involved in cell wall biosynthesis
VLRRSDRVIVLTQTWADWVRSIEPLARTTVIGNPVTLPPDVSERQPGTILFLGRLWQEKGIFDLLNAAARLSTAVPGFRLICAGDGDYALVRQTAVALGIADRLSLPGWIDGAAKQSLLEQAAVFVLPSYFEGLPMGVLEAMAYGIPVVATDVGGVRDAVGDDAGLLVAAGDVDALAEALKDVLCNSALQADMGAAGRRRVAAEFEAGRVLDKLGEVYRDLGVLPCPVGRIRLVQEPV